jgi:predicted DNA-binding transcriptional regulator YafY
MRVKDGESELLHRIRRAVIERKTARFLYHTRFSEDGNSRHHRREADPYGLVNFTGIWYLIAYCHLRKEIRHFRLDRCADIEILEKPFKRPADFSLEQPARDEGRNTIIRALFDKEIADWVKEAKIFFVEEMTDTAEGLLVVLRVRTENEVLNWILGWGGRVKILEPASLQKRLIREAKKILENHRSAM